MNSYDGEEDDPFIQLEKFEPGEWPNIPRPLLLLAICMQECISISHKTTKSMVDKSLKASEENKKRLQDLDQQFPILKSQMAASESSLSLRINEVNSKLTEDLNSFKSSLNKDLDFKQKSTDSKLNSLQEQLFALKKVVNTLPFIQEIENSIQNACSNLRISLKKEVTDYIVKPEVASLNSKILTVNENSEKYISKLQEVQEVHTSDIKVLTDQFSEKFVSFERILAQTEKDFKESSNYSEVLLQKLGKDLKSIESNSIDKIGSHNNMIVSLEGKLKVAEQQMKGVGLEIQGLKNRFELMNQENFKIFQALKEVEEAQIEMEKKLKERKLEDKVGAEGLERLEGDDEVGHGDKEIELVVNVEKDENEDSVEDKLSENVEKVIGNDFNLELLPDADESQLKFFPVQNNFNNFEFSEGLEEINRLKEKVKEIEIKIKETQENFASFQTSQKEKLDSDLVLKEIHEKLQWFPMSINQVKNKPPSEARLYTLEARLRMEENTRFEQFNHLLTTLNHVKLELCSQDPANNAFPNAPVGRRTAQVGGRRSSRDNLVSVTRKTQESELKPRFDTKIDTFKANGRRLSSDTERTPRTGYFHRIPVNYKCYLLEDLCSVRTISATQKKKPTIFKNIQVPERVILDIKDAFAYFDPQNQGFITVSQLKTLLQYIAGGNYGRKELLRAIKDVGDNPTVDVKDAEKIAFSVWLETGYQEEARDVFKLFDKKDKGTTTFEEVKSVIQQRIDLPVQEEDFEELKNLLGVQPNTPLTNSNFKQYSINRLEKILSSV